MPYDLIETHSPETPAQRTTLSLKYQRQDTGSWRVRIVDHPVDFFIDYGSMVSAISEKHYKLLITGQAMVGMVGELKPTNRTSRGATFAKTRVSGSGCNVSFMDPHVILPIIIRNLHTDAVIGNNTLGSHCILKQGRLVADGV